MALLIKMLQKRLNWVLLTICVSVLAIAVTLWWNSQLSSIINSINGNLSISLQAILQAVMTIVISSGLSYAVGILSGWTCETLTHDLRMGYARHLGTLTFAEIEAINAGEQISKLQNEINDVSVFLSSNLFPIINDLICFIGTFSWILWLNPKLTVLAHLPVVFIMWYIVYTSRIIGNAAQKSQQANSKMCGYIDSLILAFPVLRIFNGFSLISNRYSESLRLWQVLSAREERTKAKLGSLSAILSCIPLLLILLLGGTQVINGELTIGTLYIFINLSGNVSGVMMNMPGRIASFRRFIVDMERLETSVIIEERW